MPRWPISTKRIRNRVRAHQVTRDRDSQVIFGGPKDDKEDENVIKQVNKILSHFGVQDKSENVFTYEDPAKVCVVQFKTPRAKIGFFKKAKDGDMKWDSGERMWWKNNDDIAKRIVDKTLGQIKFHLVEKGTPINDVKIKWKQQTVKIKDVQVAEVRDDGVFQTSMLPKSETTSLIP